MMKNFKIVFICQILVYTSLFQQLKLFAYDEECFDQYFLDNCEHIGIVTLTIPCSPYPGSPYCIIEYEICVLGKQIRILNYSWSGTCSCMNIEHEILYDILRDAERFDIDAPGCYFDFRVQLMGCFIEIDITNGSIIEGKQLSPCKPTGAEQCCGVGYKVCYVWSCPGGINCNLKISSFEAITSSAPITECPVGCNSECDRWLIYSLPAKQSAHIEMEQFNSNTNLLVKEDYLEIVLDRKNSISGNILVNVFDILGQEFKSEFQEVVNNKLILGLQNIPFGYNSIIIRVEDNVYVKNFIKY